MIDLLLPLFDHWGFRILYRAYSMSALRVAAIFVTKIARLARSSEEISAGAQLPGKAETADHRFSLARELLAPISYLLSSRNGRGNGIRVRCSRNREFPQ
jgi:hypothetical protein